jgi:AraC-like DNA-binding protein
LEYITQERLRMARELLRQTDYPVSRVAGSVVYNNLSYFTKIFKRETGMTPQEYRQAGNA